jgi:hypothetical protein
LALYDAGAIPFKVFLDPWMRAVNAGVENGDFDRSVSCPS